MTKGEFNLCFLIGALGSAVFQIYVQHTPPREALVGTIIAIALLIIWRLFGVVFRALDRIIEEHEQCPRLILGYGSCNKWRDLPCDHSESEVARAKAARRQWRNY